MESNFAADEALAQVQSAREQMARRVTTPAWYHPCLGCVEGLLIFSMSFPTSGWGTAARLVVAIAALAAIAVLVRVYRRLTGVWIGPKQAGPRARRPWIWLVLIMVVCLLLALAAQVLPGSMIWGALLAVVGWASMVVLGRRFDDGLRADIRAGQADVMMPA